MFDGLCPALLPSGNAEIRLGAGHWVLGRPALSDRQIPLKNSARQCSSYFQIACAIITCETALLEIGKHLELQLVLKACAVTRSAAPLAWRDASVNPFVAPPRVVQEREIPADVRGCCCGATGAPDDEPIIPVPVPLPFAFEEPPAPTPVPTITTTTHDG